MDTQEILAKVDALFEKNRGEEAHQLLLDSVDRAVKEQDDESLLQLLNELIGYYRTAGEHDSAYRVGQQAITLAERMGLSGTVPYATTLLNMATACRAGGRLTEAMEYYVRTQELYDGLFPSDNTFTAGLQNNLSLLYQEMGEYETAKSCQMKALQIAENLKADYELAVTCANLASTCAQLGQLSEAEQYGNRALQGFRQLGVEDGHYGAALAALGACCFRRREYTAAMQYYSRAIALVEQTSGRSEAYRRLQEQIDACERALLTAGVNTESGHSLAGGAVEGPAAGNLTAGEAAKNRQVGSAGGDVAGDHSSGMGLELCWQYYKTYGAPMIAEQFDEYESRIAVGLVGRGSDCFGYDDQASRDHDWGPGFCMWLTDQVYDRIGAALQQAYDRLPEEFQGYRRAPEVNGKGRRGVWRISDFYRSLVGADRFEEIDWRQVSDHSLAAAVNGQVFRDDEGCFTEFRNKLKEGYPEEIRYLKIAESAASFAQAAQYNYGRMLERKEHVTARMMAWDGIKAAMKLQHYIEGKYPPHDKWLHRSLRESEPGREVSALLEQISHALERPVGGNGEANEVAKGVEALGAHLAMEMYGQDIISDIHPYLDAHSQELVYKASMAAKSCEELVEEIARLEFEAFDKVKNEGGRASCQNDWPTFSIMRKSQYLTWDRTMLTQYLYDFHRELSLGHNLIEEKYGRMMESTAPEQYEELKAHFPELTQEKKAIIEQICSMQVGWMEEFAAKYPALADNARSIHTYQDNPFDTSYETYLRGELGTYSDKMLELYGRYIVNYARAGRNLARDIMGNSVRMYGYESIEEAESKTARAQGQ